MLAPQGKLGLIDDPASLDVPTINGANLRRAHALIESGKARGEIVLSGF